MADSENSRILPITTRRNILSAGATLAVAAMAGPSSAPSGASPHADAPLLSLWQDWNNAHRRRCALTARQRQLEAEHADISTEPAVTLTIPGREQPFVARSVAEIKQALPFPEAADAITRALKQLRFLQQRSNTIRWELGYTQTCKEEVITDRLAWRLAEALWNSPANSLDGVVAKLHSMIEMEGPEAFVNDNPIRVLRAILADLVRINSIGPEGPGTIPGAFASAGMPSSGQAKTL